MNHRLALIAAASFAALSMTPAWADDVTNQLDKAKAAYEAHDLRGAQKAIDNAENGIRQQRLTQWKTVLPDALDGWKAENVEGTAAAMAMLGGGVSISRRYRKGGTSVTIELIADSPIVASFAGVMKMLTTIGAETFTIGDQQIVSRKDEHSLMALVADKALVTVKGQGASDDDLKDYAKAIHFAAIEALLK